MNGVTFVVPRGAEAVAVRRGGLACVEIAAGAASARTLPAIPEAPVVLLGLCGALGDRRVGDVVIFRSAAGDAGSYRADEALTAALHARLPAASPVDGWTAVNVVTRRDERRALHARGFTAVDMEAAHLARVFAARSIPWASIRVVSDDAEHDLPPIAGAIDGEGRLVPARLAAGFAKAPVAAARFVRNVRVALDALRRAAFVLNETAAFTAW